MINFTGRKVGSTVCTIIYDRWLCTNYGTLVDSLP